MTPMPRRVLAGLALAQMISSASITAAQTASDSSKPTADSVKSGDHGAPSASRPQSGAAVTQSAAAQTSAGASAAAAASANVELARQHFRRGIDSYRDGDLATALIEFKRAYSTAPNFRLLYNLGQVSAELRDYPAAERYLTQYLRESRDAIDEARQQAVQAELAKVRARIAFLHLSSNVEGAELLVDDVVVGRTPLDEAVHVSSGRRRISARAPGHSPVTQIVDAAGGEDVSVTLTLQPIPSQIGEPIVARPPRQRGGTRKPLLIGLAIGTGVLAAGGAVFAYLAQNEAADYRAALERKTSADELKGLADGARTKALVTDFLLGAALLSATVGVVVLLNPDADTREHAAVRVGPGRIELTRSF